MHAVKSLSALKILLYNWLTHGKRKSRILLSIVIVRIDEIKNLKVI